MFKKSRRHPRYRGAKNRHSIGSGSIGEDRSASQVGAHFPACKSVSTSSSFVTTQSFSTTCVRGLESVLDSSSKQSPLTTAGEESSTSQVGAHLPACKSVITSSSFVTTQSFSTSCVHSLESVSDSSSKQIPVTTASTTCVTPLISRGRLQTLSSPIDSVSSLSGSSSSGVPSASLTPVSRITLQQTPPEIGNIVLSDVEFHASRNQNYEPHKKTKFKTLSLKPLDLFKKGSMSAVSQRSKRRRILTSSAHKSRKRRNNTADYCTNRENVLNKRTTRYASSPEFVERVLQSVRQYYSIGENKRRKVEKVMQQYHNCSPFRRTASECASNAIKRKYAAISPFRRKTLTSAKQRYYDICKSSSKKRRIRQSELIYRRRQSESLTTRRRILYHQDKDRRKKAIQRASQWRSKARLQEKIADATTCAIPGEKGVSLISKSFRSLFQRNYRLNKPYLPPLQPDTAEYRANKLSNWKRYKINQLLAFCKTESRSQQALRKAQVTRLLHQLLSFQREERSSLYNLCEKITKVFSLAQESVTGVAPEETEASLQEFYGGLRYHLTTCEYQDFEKSKATYSPFAAVFPNEDAASNSLQNTMVRKCDANCAAQIPNIWATFVHQKLGSLSDNVKIRSCLHRVHLLENCASCNLVEGLCSSADTCSDLLRKLLALRVHFVGIRSLMRDVHRIRYHALRLHILELLFMNGSYIDYVSCKKYFCPGKSQQDVDSTHNTVLDNVASDEVLLKQYGSLVASFEEGVTDSMEIHECMNCLRLVTRGNIISLGLNDTFCSRKDVLDLISVYQMQFAKVITMLLLCKSCRSSFKRNETSQYSYRNNMWPDPMPPQLSRLNAYERNLICLSKCFQRIVKLKPYTYRGPDNILTRAIKGFVVHLPLPSGTLANVSSAIKSNITLPDCSNFLIQVDSLPNLSKKVLFRSLVDMNLVMEALVWLKNNNSLYENVIIDDSFLLDDSLQQLPAIVYTSDDLEKDATEDNLASVDMTKDSNAAQSSLLQTDLESKLVASKRKVRKRQESFFDPKAVPSKLAVSQLRDRASKQIMDVTPAAQNCGAVDGTDHLSSGIVGSGNTTTATTTASVTVSRTGDETVPDTDISVTSKSVHLGGRQSEAVVKTMNFPIPYTIPYKKYFLDQLADRSSSVMHVPEDELLEDFSIIQMEKSLPKLPDLELFALKPIMSKPLYWDDPKIDVASFPHLYPFGKGGVYDDRVRVVTPAFYYEHVFRSSDSRFRRETPFLFDAGQKKDMMTLYSSVYTMLNTGRFGRITAGEITKQMSNPAKSSTLERNVSTMLRNIVGTPQYWTNVRRDLEAVIEEHGPATFFLTVSCGEYKNQDFKDFLILRNTDVPNIRNSSIRNIVAIDPVSVALHFHKRFQSFWDKVIMSEHSPLGCVERFYIKKEYQQRGAPHMHVLLWIRDAPVHGRDNDDDVLNFITRRISCSLPDAIESPILHNLVTHNQMHRCTASCLRSKYVKGKFYSKFCRYGFPRKSEDSPKLNATEEVLKAKATGKGRIKLYSLRRNAAEMMINDYNPALLYMWKANMDIQYIKDDKQCLVYYTTAYVCKAEKQLISQVVEAVNTGLSAAGMLTQMACKLLSSRQIGAYEAADKVLRHPPYRLSECIKFASFQLPGEQRRRLKLRKDLEALPADSDDVYYNNFQCTYYPRRPKALEKLSAFEVLRDYDYRYGKKSTEDPLYVSALGIFFVRRKSKAVVRMYKSISNDPVAVERYCFQIVALFRPWRSVDDLLKDTDGNIKSTYTEVYDAIKDKLVDLQRFESARQRLRDMIEWAENIKQEAQRKLEAQVEIDRNANHVDDVQDTVEGLDVELCQHSKNLRSALSEEDVRASYKQLNNDQRAAFDMVIKSISEAASSPSIRTEPIRVFVSGVGGTGKSFLITTIRNHLEYYYSSDTGPSVLVAAPTGVAAVNIDGVTIHKLLKLPVSKSKKSSQTYWPLHPQDVKVLRLLFANVKLLIIDEISMLSNLYLLFIHKRLNEILVDEEKDFTARFGNVNVLLLGDLLQLPPVNAPYIFQPLLSKQIADSFGSIGIGLDLWDKFQFVELLVNMRQRDDGEYASMLDRIRIGSPNEDDLVRLRTRLINTMQEADPDWKQLLSLAVDNFLQLLHNDKYALCLMPLNQDVSSFNEKVMQVLNLKAVHCHAEDTMKTESFGGSARRSKQKSTAADVKKKSKSLTIAETGGMEEALSVAVGARVMLRRNIDVKLKLVNGSIGFVTSIHVNPDSNVPEIIEVQFQDTKQITPITRVKVSFCVGANLYIERNQFPLTLAYAVTIHKCQGLSLQSAMVDIGEPTFSDGMAYVALSRVKSLNSLHLIRICGAKIKCDARCVREYNRLRRAAGIDKDIKDYNKNPEFKTWKFYVSSEDQSRQLQEQQAVEAMFAKDKTRTEVALPKRGRPLKKKLVSASITSISPGTYLKFENTDGHSCFANSVVQSILRCHDLYPLLLQCHDNNPVSKALLALFHMQNKKSTLCCNTDGLRDAFGSSSQYSRAASQNCDPTDFINAVLGSVSVQVSDAFKYVKSIVGTCSHCSALNTIEDGVEQFIEYGLQVDLHNYVFDEVFRSYTSRIHRCSECEILDHSFVVRAEYQFPPASKYLVLCNPVMFGGHLIDKALLRVRDKRFNLFGKRWNLISCIQMSANTTAASSNRTVESLESDDAYRHYRAYVYHGENAWVCLDDRYYNLLKRRPIFKHMMLMILEHAV